MASIHKIIHGRFCDISSLSWFAYMVRGRKQRSIFLESNDSPTLLWDYCWSTIFVFLWGANVRYGPGNCLQRRYAITVWWVRGAHGNLRLLFVGIIRAIGIANQGKGNEF